MRNSVMRNDAERAVLNYSGGFDGVRYDIACGGVCVICDVVYVYER